MPKLKSTTYTRANFEQIATAIGTTVKPVADLEAQFEAAALWFRLDKRRPKRPAPSKQHDKLTQIAKSARRVLKSLGIDDADNAVDGPGDHEILMALVLAGEPDENAVLETTRRIGRLVEFLEGIAAAGELERRAHQAATELAAVGKLTVREGNPGDDAVNDWTAAMLGIYRTLTGKEPATSVGRPRAPMKGKRQVPSFGFFKPLASH
jgi:membrane-associated protease RseP (regulator of RpoE activity)